MDNTTSKTHPQNDFWLRVAIGTGVIFVAGGLFYLKICKRSIDEQIVRDLSRKISDAFPLAMDTLVPLIPERSKTIRDDNISLVLHVAKNVVQKDKVAVLTKDPFQPPFEKGMVISDLNPGHRLLYNKYYFYHNHLLIVTQRFEQQTSPLTRQDFLQTILAMSAIKGCFFFNCGPQSGFSQKHKHIQILPEQALGLPIMAKLIELTRGGKTTQLGSVIHKGNKIYLFEGYEFIHGLIPINSNSNLQQTSQQFYQAYITLHSHLTTILKNKDISFNLIGCKQFLVMIPRKKEKLLDQIGINAVGFMGSILSKDGKVFEKLEYLLKPTDILRQLTFTEFP